MALLPLATSLASMSAKFEKLPGSFFDSDGGSLLSLE